MPSSHPGSVVEVAIAWRAGVLKVDTDHDGDLDYTARMRGWHQPWDWGMVEHHIHRFSLTRMIDDDADGMLEWKQRTIHMSNATDWDFDHHLEQRESYTATLTWWDSNEDGYEEHIFRRVRETYYLDQHAHGWTFQTEETRSMEVWRNSLHQPHRIRIVVNELTSWDNNSDGSPEGRHRPRRRPRLHRPDARMASALGLGGGRVPHPPIFPDSYDRR
jgi:hypothetical protein